MTREAIKKVVLKYNISSIVDAPCGDLTWMPLLFPFFRRQGVSYTGVDIVASEIRRHKSSFPEQTFAHLDMVQDMIPRADMVFSRQALQHMNAEDNLRVLNTWTASGSRFVMQTTYDTALHGNFASVRRGENSMINFQAAPYHFPAPIEQFEEQRQVGFVEYLGLWPIPHLLSRRTAPSAIPPDRAPPGTGGEKLSCHTLQADRELDVIMARPDQKRWRAVIHSIGLPQGV